MLEEEKVLEPEKVDEPTEEKNPQEPVGEDKVVENNEETEKLKKANADLISQLAEERTKRRLAEASNRVEKPTPTEEPKDDVEKKVLDILRKQKEEDIKKNREDALNKFWNKHPEYHPNNDTGGILMDNLRDVLTKRFNISSSQSIEDIENDYEDALLYIGKKKESKQESPTEFASGGAGSPKPKVIINTHLTPKEKQDAKDAGISEERYIQLKNKYPNVI